MSAWDELNLLPPGFSGHVRLFPLPNVVLFPTIVQPLHLFEPRYIAMMEEALRTDRLLTMTVLRQGWEPGYESAPPIHQVGCIGRVVLHDQLPDGRFNLLLQGLCRVRLVEELDPSRGFRRARVVPICDQPAPEKDGAALRAKLVELFSQWVRQSGHDCSKLDVLSQQKLDLARLTDVLSYVTDLPIDRKVELLGESSVKTRAEHLISAFTRSLGPGGAPAEPSSATSASPWFDEGQDDTFPPRFSAN